MTGRPEPLAPVALASRPAQALSAEQQADVALCRRFIQHHSKSFYLSSLLLPRALRPEAWALYAFCRQADDSVDGVNPGDGTVPADAPTETAAMLAQVAALRQRLRRVYDGHPGKGPEHAIDRAFFAVIRRTGLPQALPQRLLDGMEHDARGQSYRTHDELLGYCFDVAATVGLMMTYVMGYTAPAARREEVFLRASDLGVAMQLSNIARDVGEDARRGRVYLPDELLARHGLDADAVLAIGQAQRPPPQSLRSAVADLLNRAEAHYCAARAGIPMLPSDVRLAIRSAQIIYSAIGDRLAAQGFDAITRRAAVGGAGKLLRIGQAFLIGLWPPNRRMSPEPTVGPADALLRRLCQEVEVL